MERRNSFIKALILLLAIPVGTALFAANPFSTGEATTFTDVQVNDDAYVTDDLTVDGTITGAVTGAVTGNVTGNLTGNVTGNVTGNLTGNVTTGTTATLTGLITGGSQKIDATNGTTITGWYRGTATINASASTGTATITGVTASDKAMAVGITDGANQSVEAVVPGSGSVAITMTGNVATTTTVEVWVMGQ